jgi:hypothetical protein
MLGFEGSGIRQNSFMYKNAGNSGESHYTNSFEYEAARGQTINVGRRALDFIMLAFIFNDQSLFFFFGFNGNSGDSTWA